MTMPSSAFLQPHVRRLEVRAGAALTLLPGTKIGLWRVTGDRRAGTRSDAYRVVLDGGRDGHARASMTVFDTPAVHLGSYTRRILAIAQILATIDHPGVASSVDAGVLADGRPYLVSDLDRGISLATCIADGPMDPQRALTILRAICAPLIAAHDRGVAHGSLEPAHVFLVNGDDHCAMLLDWGTERAVFEEARRTGIERPEPVTCAAPEQALGIVSPQTDAYALGVLAYQLLLGRAPFEASSAEVMRELQEDYAVDPRALWPQMPDSLEAVLHGLLAVDPRVRPSIRTAADRFAAISRELAAVSEAAYDSLELEVARRPPLRPRTFVAGFTAMLAAALLIVFFAPRESHRAAASAANPKRVEPAALALAPATLAPAALAPAARAPTAPPIARAPAAPAPAARAPVPPRVVRAPVPSRLAPAARAPAPAMAVRAKRTEPVRRRSVERDVAETRPDPKAELLIQYQRLGHALVKLQQQRGHAATSELMQQFKSLEIQPSLATAQSRAAAAAVLGELRSKLERQRGIDIADACLANPLADGCR